MNPLVTSASHDAPQDGVSSRPRIVVLGSLNMDMVLRVPHAPEAGETVNGRSMATVPGGKGDNQAVSCVRQGAAVSLLGRIGSDDHGRALLDALTRDGIDHGGVETDPNEPTGLALVMVDDAAQNRIVVIAGANAKFEVNESDLAQQLRGAEFLVAQLETPLIQVVKAVTVAHCIGCKVLLNASPAQALPEQLWPLLDTLVVNEGEARLLSGLPADTPTQAATAASALRERGVARVVITLGAAGAVAADAQGRRHHPALAVNAVDTTAAGDTFLGALAVMLANGQSFDAAVRHGIRAAALCVTKVGAQPSIPDRDAVLRSPLPPDWISL